MIVKKRLTQETNVLVEPARLFHLSDLIEDAEKGPKDLGNQQTTVSSQTRVWTCGEHYLACMS